MDAGVPIKAPVAGIAMGLVFAEGKYTTLTDILGAEDAFGDMDFKVAGTSEFVTALQLDTKIDGLPADVLAKALRQAYEARLKILEVMAGRSPEPNADVKGTRPEDRELRDPDRQDRRGHRPEGQGHQRRSSRDRRRHRRRRRRDGRRVTIGAKEATRRRGPSTHRADLRPAEAEVGAVYPGKVVNITKFGAFVNILPGRDGLLHISRLGGGKRVERVEDVLELGQSVEVSSTTSTRRARSRCPSAPSTRARPTSSSICSSRARLRGPRSRSPRRSTRSAVT
jgi:polyribonucleotide nucleotidyltransferase